MGPCACNYEGAKPIIVAMNQELGRALIVFGIVGLKLASSAPSGE